MLLHRRTVAFLFNIIVFASVQSQPRPGYIADEITLPAANGDTLRLSSLREKVVLLNFWASWCGPCRVANRGLTKLYAKFKTKGFEIYSVSLDEKKENWLKAIKKDKITWLQVIDQGGWNSPTARRWWVDALPASYLIDKDGRLVAINLEGKELEIAVRELL